MTIGFDVEKQKRDRSDYDLLASEARLASFVAIAQGQVHKKVGLPWTVTSDGQTRAAIDAVLEWFDV